MENNKFQISGLGVLIVMVVITAIVIFAFSGPLETSSEQIYNKTEKVKNK